MALWNILSSSKTSITPALLLTTVFTAVNIQDMMINPPIAKDLKIEYDFIVVGAGSAGSVVASRLSEDPNYKVLLLEAGGEATEDSEIPALQGTLTLTELDWNYTVGPNSDLCLGMIDKTCHYPRGKVLGGSSTINNMIYTRGNKKDYDDWAALGNYGWSFEDVLPYFKKSEDNTNTLFAKNSEFHSTGGLLTVSDMRWTTPVAQAFLEMGVERGYSIGDVNAKNQTVFAIPQLTSRDGLRCSTNKAFLVPAGERKNLDIATHAQVTKILIEPETRHTYGVRYLRNGAFHDVYARKEVIISGGTFNTPQILMLSGIGPKDHLGEFDIPLIKDLPVGLNLLDQSGLPLLFVTDKPVTLIPERLNTLLANMSFELEQEGPLTHPGMDGIAFVNSHFKDPNEDRPDLQLCTVPVSPATDGGLLRKNLRMSDEFYDAAFRPIEHLESFIILVSLSRPKSVGRISLKSKDPFQKPEIQLNLFSHEDDVRVLSDGARITLEFMLSKAITKINATYHHAQIPTCPDALPYSNQYFECLMRYGTIMFFHAAGTSKMGPENDASTVVDPELRVHGVSGLRVADASIMPTMITGTTNAPAIMIGEKASDMIIKSWKGRGNAAQY